MGNNQSNNPPVQPIQTCPPCPNTIGVVYNANNPTADSTLKALNGVIQGAQKIMCSIYGKSFYQYILNSPVKKEVFLVADEIKNYKSMINNFIQSRQDMPIEMQNFLNKEMVDLVTTVINNCAVNGKTDQAKVKQHMLDVLISLCPTANATVISKSSVPVPIVRNYLEKSSFGMSNGAKYGTVGCVALLIIIAVVIFFVMKKKKKVSFGKRK